MMESNKSIKQHKPDDYVDLKDTHYYTVNDDVVVLVKDGQIAISDVNSATKFVLMSEWDFGNLVDAWLDDRLAQKFEVKETP